LPFTELARIKTPKLSESDIKSLSILEDELDKHAVEVNKVRQSIDEYVDCYMGNKRIAKKALPENNSMPLVKRQYNQ